MRNLPIDNNSIVVLVTIKLISATANSIAQLNASILNFDEEDKISVVNEAYRSSAYTCIQSLANA